MFGGLTKTSSRIAIAAALGLALGGFAFKATPAQAADLGGDCCADLEERVAELEATTVRKGNKKVSVTLSGWVVKSMNWWTDGDIDSFVVGDKDADLASRFAITGSATIAPGWSAGYNLTVVAPGGADNFSSTFGILLESGKRVQRYQRQYPDALFLHLRKERYVGRPQLGLFEPGIRQPGGACRHFWNCDRIERGVFRRRGLLSPA